MEKNKEIGKAFREKLDQLDKAPSDALWSKIDSDLDSKKKKKSIFWFVPLWIVSGLILGGMLYTFCLTENNGDANPENFLQNKVATGENHVSGADNASAETKNTITEGKNTSTEAKNTITQEKNTSTKGKNTSIERKNTVTEEKNTSTKGKKAITDQDGPKTGANNASDKTISSSKTARTVKKTKRLVKSTEEYDEYEVVQKYTYIVKKKKKTITVPAKKKHITKSKNNKKLSQNKPKSKSGGKPKKQPEVKTAPELTESKKSNLLTADTKTDSVAMKPIVEVKPKVVPKKEIKKPITTDSIPKEKEKKQVYITPYFAPTFYESFAKGNSVSSQYQDDPKKAVLTYSYGCYARWMFSPKMGSRIGVGKTNLEYTTNTRKSNTSVIDTKNINLDPGIAPADINAKFENDTEVLLSQKLSYYEVPLEAYYVFSDRKIGMATAFGLSFLILDKNELTLQSGSVSEYKIGSAKNTIDQSVTGNLKLIFDYKLSEFFQLEVSPSFQYHVMGFKDASDFKPYILSLQAGFSYKL